MKNDNVQIILESLLKSVSAIDSKIEGNGKLLSNMKIAIQESDLAIQKALKEKPKHAPTPALVEIDESPTIENSFIPKILVGVIAVLILTCVFLMVNRNSYKDYYYKYELVKRFNVEPEQVEESFGKHRKLIVSKIDSLDKIKSNLK